ncbi:MAG: 2Fe-2S iron-sulfur cluster-binding protein [Granulosicoccus sp.]
MSLTLKVENIRQCTSKIRLIELVGEQGEALPDYTAGAHIKVDVGDKGQRAYSLIQWSGALSSPSRYIIAVQREDAGEGGSAFMHTLTIGQTLTASKPDNDFELCEHKDPVVLIAGGIGITPIITMAATLLDQGRIFHCHYTGRTRSSMALLTELEQHIGSCLSIYTDDEAPLDINTLIDNCDASSHLFICGPKGMIDAVRSKAVAANFMPEQIHIELFNSPEAENSDRNFEVEVSSTGQVYVIPVGQSIIDVLNAEGIDLVFDCQRGDCGICQVDVLSGIPDHRDVVLSDEERSSGNVMQICVSRAKSDRLVLDI